MQQLRLLSQVAVAVEAPPVRQMHHQAAVQVDF
jgi:hypothetical protein